MSQSWWIRFLFVLGLVVLSFGSLIPTYVEMVAYPETPTEDPEVDLTRIATLFEVAVRTEGDLLVIEETINEEAGFYRGEGTVRVSLLGDGSVLGWVDDNHNNSFDKSFEKDPAFGGELPALKSKQREQVFRIYLTEAAGAEGAAAQKTLVLIDRHYRVLQFPITRTILPNEAIWTLMNDRLTQANGGQPWTVPAAWLADAERVIDANVNQDDTVIAGREPPLPGWYDWYSKNTFSRTLTLGLDLKGGLLMRYSVAIDDAIESQMRSFAADIERRIGRENVTAEKVEGENSIVLTFAQESGTKLLDDELMQSFNALNIIGEEGAQITLGLREDYLKETSEGVMKQAVETIRKRVDQFGLANPSVRTEQGGRHIMVELPGLSKRRAREAERLIGTTAVLTFRLIAPRQTEAERGESPTFDKFWAAVQREQVDEIFRDGAYIASRNVYAPNGALVRQGKSVLKTFVLSHRTLIPPDREVVYEEIVPQVPKNKKKDEETKQQAQVYWRARLITTDPSIPVVTGDQVADARQAFDPTTNIPEVSLTLKSQGGTDFENITRKYTKEQLAILLDDTVISDPVIQNPIPGGRVSITMGSGDRQEILEDVNTLVISLLSGALDAPIEQEFKTLVGPTLGRDSIASGGLALLIGFSLVVFFMLIYYRMSGLIANVALGLNVLFILAIMATLGATLTLPGIAGIVLTVGMAVDANVIIFERIREEIRAGVMPGKAIAQGYDKAYWTILDANITTGLAAVVLMEFGSGPVKGFAVTLLIGIVCSVFTAVFVTRLLYELLLSRGNVERLSI